MDSTPTTTTPLPAVACQNCVNDKKDEPNELLKPAVTPTSPIKIPQLTDHHPLALVVRCPNADRGCARELTSSDQLEPHSKECAHRPYRCIGHTLNVWNCDWVGLQSDIDVHFQSDHPALGEMFKQNGQGYVPFDGTQQTATVNLCDAFGRRFVFYYHTDCTAGMVYFCVFLLGQPTEAKRYSVSFELHGGPNNREKIEFQTQCPSDMDDIPRLVREERFVAVTHRSIAKYLDEHSQIHFRFVVKDKEAREASKTTENALENADKKVPAKAATSTPAKPKGPIRPSNLFRKGASIPTTGPTSSGPPKMPSSTSQSSVRPSSNWDYPSFTPKPEPPAAHRPSLYIPPPDQSQSVHQAPACLSAASSPTVCQKSGPDVFRPQPYKGVDHKFYTVKYPSSSIHKPLYRK